MFLCGRAIFSLDDYIRLSKPGFDISFADFIVDTYIRIANLGVDARRVFFHRLERIRHNGQIIVFNLDQTSRGLSCRLALCDDGCHLIADKAHYIGSGFC